MELGPAFPFPFPNCTTAATAASSDSSPFAASSAAGKH